MTAGGTLGSVTALVKIARARKAEEMNMSEDGQATDIEVDDSSTDQEYTEVVHKKRKLDMLKFFEKPRVAAVTAQEPNLALQNRYAPLLNSKINENAGINTPVNTKPRTPPPIVIHQKVIDHRGLIKFITEIAGKQFHVKYTAGRTTVQTYDNKIYKVLLKELTEQNLKFHTYTPKDEKTHGFVLRGLDSEPSTEEIKEDLETTHKIQIQKMYKMHTKFRPLYLVVTENNINLQFLQENIRYVCRTKIRWERHTNNKVITQCRRCQEWGHSTTNCFDDPRCAHCAQDHWTHQCTNKENKKCTNCGNQGHKAYDTDCPVYQRRLELIKRINTPEKLGPAYVAAPLPKTNAWGKRPTPAVEEQNDSIMRTRTFNAEDYPELPQVRQEQRRPQTQQAKPPLEFNAGNEYGNLAAFQNLNNEFKKLNSLINLEKMLKLVQNLNSQLSLAQNNIEKFMITQNFLSNLSDDDF